MESMARRVSLFIKRIFLSIPTRNLFYGNLSLQKVLSWNFKKNKNHIIYNSLNYDFHKKMRTKQVDDNVYERQFKNKNPVLLFIGRLTHVKKIDQFLWAVKKLKNQGHDYNITIIGEGSKKEELQKISTQNNLNTWFYGACYDEGILHVLIKNADLCVSPGNVGLTLIHCLSYGTPVITHNDFAYQMPESEAIVPSVNGDFFKKDSIDDLSIKIKQWFENNKDLIRETIRNNCYSIIDEKYNPHYQSALIEKVVLNDLQSPQ